MKIENALLKRIQVKKMMTLLSPSLKMMIKNPLYMNRYNNLNNK